MTLADLDRDLTARRATLHATVDSGEWAVTLISSRPRRCVTKWAATLVEAVEMAFMEWDSTWTI